MEKANNGTNPGALSGEMLPDALAEVAALLDSAAGYSANQLAAAADKLHDFLETKPANPEALELSIQVETRRGRLEEVEKLFQQTLEITPERADARWNYVQLLREQRKEEEAGRQVDILLQSDPHDPRYLAMRGVTLTMTGEQQKGLEYHELAIAACPDDAFFWVLYGNGLRSVGRTDKSIAAYRKAIALQPGFGQAWWALADLKTFRFEPVDIETMKNLLDESGELSEADRFHMHFALGKALEDRGAYADSFGHYRKANTIRRAGLRHNPDVMSDLVRQMRAIFTEEFFDARRGLGCPARDPIFVVGTPRAGSTLVEQILASHSAIEGTMELPALISIIRRLLASQTTDKGSAYAQIMQSLDGVALQSLGEEYLELTRVHRKTPRPFFVDKMPTNFHHLGFLHLVLPNARIVDVRRHPLGSCFSNFKQNFDSSGQGVAATTYDLTELGRYYRDYVELMAHFDSVLPGRVHRVFYEDLVHNPEEEIRRLLYYCGVPFEESCLRFHQTERSVLTFSSEQVRRPIYADSVEQWRHYEPWLGPLKKALGPVLTAYPNVPEF